MSNELSKNQQKRSGSTQLSNSVNPETDGYLRTMTNPTCNL